jgi:hypothetical protein
MLGFAVVALGPAMGAGRGIDKLGSDADTVAGAANAALQHVARTQLASDLPHIDGPAPLYLKLELRAMTRSSENRDSSVMMSSVMPSLKYS